MPWCSRSIVATVLAAAFVTTSNADGQTTSDFARWGLRLGLQEAYETNPSYGAAETDGDVVTRVGARLTGRAPFRRGRFELELDGGVVLYRNFTDLSQTTWGVGASAARSLSRQTSLELSAHSSRTYARDYAVLQESGVVPAYALTRGEGLSASLRHAVSRSTLGQLELRADRFQFESAGLQNGSTLSVNGDLGRALRRRTSLGLAGEYQRTSSFGPTFEVEEIRAYCRSGTGYLSVDLDAGLGRYRPTGSLWQTTPTGGVGAAVHAGRYVATAQLGRRVGQTYGLGTIGLSRAAAFGLSLAVSRRLGLGLRADDTLELAGFDLDRQGQAPRARAASLDLRYRLNRRVTLIGSYSYWSRTDGALDSQGQSIAASVSGEFRRR